VDRKAAMQATAFGLLNIDPHLANAWDRIEGKVVDNAGEQIIGRPCGFPPSGNASSRRTAVQRNR
jgi:hypothetical protein